MTHITDIEVDDIVLRHRRDESVAGLVKELETTSLILEEKSERPVARVSLAKSREGVISTHVKSL